MTYDIFHFIAKFDAIDDEYWEIKRRNNRNKSWVLGHCGMRKKHTVESRALMGIFSSAGLSIFTVSAGRDHRYRQRTPRSRVLCALLDIRDGKRMKWWI